MTPLEFRREVRAVETRWYEEDRRHLTLAWHHADLQHQASLGKLPPLLSVLAKKLPKPKRRGKQLFTSQFAWLSDHLGIAARPISPEAKAAMDRLRARG